MTTLKLEQKELDEMNLFNLGCQAFKKGIRAPWGDIEVRKILEKDRTNNSNSEPFMRSGQILDEWIKGNKKARQEEDAINMREFWTSVEEVGG